MSDKDYEQLRDEVLSDPKQRARYNKRRAKLDIEKDSKIDEDRQVKALELLLEQPGRDPEQQPPARWPD